MSLINREALLSFEKMDADLCATCGEHHTAEDVIMMIKTAPTVDAVEVIRCRDCKFGTHFGDLEDEWINCRNLHGKPLMPFDGFCSYGERRGGAA